QSGKNRITNSIVDKGLVLEPNFRLCGMHIHVDVFVWNRHEHDHDRKCAGWQNIPVCLADRMQDDSVTHQAAIDEKEHRIPVVLLNMRTRGEQVNFYTRPAKAFLVLDELVEQVSPEDLKNSISKAGSGRR